MRFTPFEYMQWAKGAAVGPGHRLTRSGVLPPPADLLGDPATLFTLEELEPYGPPELKERLAARAGITADRVFLVPGGSSMGLYLVGQTLLEPGDRVLAETPGYEALHRFAQFAGARVDPLPRDPAAGWAPDLDALATGLEEGATMVVLTDLHNPTGVALAPAVRDRIMELTAAHGAWLVVDRVFAEFLDPAGRRPSLVTRGDRVVTLSSLTKAFGVGSLRQGWIFADPAVVRRLEQAYDLMGVLGPSLPLRILERLLANEEAVRAWLATELAGLAEDLATLAAHPLVDFPAPAGGVSLFPRLAGADNTEGLCRWLAAERGVHLTPGRFFGDPGRVRLGLGLPPEPRRRALEALLEGLEGWVSAGR